RQTPPAARVEPAPARTEPLPRRGGRAASERPPTGTEPAASKAGPAQRVEAAPSQAEPARTAPAATRPLPPRTKPAPAVVALPFDAVLGTILYSPDRKLAIVDGRIVGLGDQVRGAQIIDITPTAVMLRDGQGRLRRLTLGTGR